MDVERLRWPADAARLEVLRASRVPRLLVVDAHAEPPDAPDCLEEWVRAGTSDADVVFRTRALLTRADRHGARPVLDEYGLLRHRDAWVSLPPVEQSIANALLEQYGVVVARDRLAARAWPHGMPTRNALDVHVLRLRRRISKLGLEIRTVRSRGYLLQEEPVA